MPPEPEAPPSAKLDVYTLGRFGVNRVSSPIQVKDGELLQAQNATVKTYNNQQGISKRDGMARLNATTASGAILSLTSLAFPDPGGYPPPPPVPPPAFYIATSTFMHYSEDGDTFGATTPTNLASSSSQRLMSYGPGGLLYYAGGINEFTWDGSAQTPMPAPSGIADGFARSLCHDTTNDRVYMIIDARVLYWDGSAWTLLPALLSPMSLAPFEGAIFAVHGNVVSTFNGTSWVTDESFVGASQTNEIIPYDDGLVVVADAVPDSLLVFKRSALGAWADISPTAPSSNGGARMVALGTDLYVASSESVSGLVVIRRYDGSTWTTDVADVAALTGSSNPIRSLATFNSKVYAVQAPGSGNGPVIKRVAGVWSLQGGGVTGRAASGGPLD